MRPKIHYSSPRLDMADVSPSCAPTPTSSTRWWFDSFLLHTAAPVGRDFYVMLEAKGKEIALLRLREQLRAVAIEHRDGCLEVAC